MFVECHVRALAVHPHEPQVLYLGTEQGLFHSRDGAGRWARVESPANGLEVWSILLLPQAPEVILVGTCPSRLFRSPDGGQTWTEPPVRLAQECPRILRTRVTALAADPIDAQTVWAGVEIDGIRRSRDGGCSWEAVGEGISSPDIHALAVVTGNGRTKRLLASTNNDLNQSTDDGQTFRPLGVGRSLPWAYCRGLAQKWGQPEVMFLGIGDGPPGSAGVIARSVDGGESWQAAQMPGRANSTVWNFAIHPADPDLVYASSVSGEVYRSTDGGAVWEKLQREFGEIRALAWTP
jgi:photosystem II stability/assembly factor-like uncharacterized protein